MKATRYDVILRVLTSAQPVRPLLAYELGGPLVQLLASGTTAPTWQAPPRLLAEAMSKAAADTVLLPGMVAGGHALVVTADYRSLDLVGTCQCGTVLGRIRPGTPLDALAVPWERHTSGGLAATA